MPASTQDHAIVIEGVTCRFGRLCALDALSLEVRRGTVMGIVGPNGAGKTTLIDVLCGLRRPDEGRAMVLGQDIVRRARSVQRQIGVVPQETALYEELTPLQNLEFSAALYGLRDPRRRIAEVLELVGLAGRAQDRAGTLSGGMKRRLVIARALLHEPSLLILDEPTLGVDMEARHQIWAHVRGLRGQGRTVFLTTNYLDEAEALCDEVAMLRAGRVIARDSPAALTALAGGCLELECTPERAREIQRAFERDPAVFRTEIADSGLTVYFDRRSPPEELVGKAMATSSVQGFRVRSPDLVEVFRAVEGGQGG
jgi:ABC-2 type transport system ATP-binding protein